MEIFGEELTWIEILGTIFGLAGVWLTVKKNIWCFPAGLINVMLYLVLFFKSKLYADASLQIFYIILLLFGWFQWKKAPARNVFVAATIKKKDWVFISAICAIGTELIVTLLKNYSDASLPYLDSLLTSMSLIAQWMVAKKKIENWIVWIVADVIYVGMYIFKHLYLTSVLYFIFIALAIIGYREWKKKFAGNEYIS